MTRSGLTHESVWMRYFALGGTAGPLETEAHIAGLVPLPAPESDVLAHAVNELLDEQTPRERVPYSRVVREPTPEGGLLGALVTALAGMHLAPPERLPTVVARAGTALGAQIGLYLIDYEQQYLRPLPGPHASTEPLGVDTSLAGRAFRTLETLSTQAGGRTRLWVPLLDGVERLGVLEVVLDPADGDDPVLRSQLRWLSTLIGHLYSITTNYGDKLDGVRRRQRRSTAAELLWQLLPTTTAATDRVTVAGMVEPCYTAAGDAFDYSLSETTAHLAIFDATGHSLDSSLVGAMAVSSYRSARRDGATLFDQARAVDEIIGTESERTGRYVTSVLAELDLLSGRLRYISAGHPYPLVVRRGKVVKSLDRGQRTVFGMPFRDLTVGEEMLEPGDWLVLYTDGITEARGVDGTFFGLDRMQDFIEKEITAGHAPPEMVRRLIRRVLEHQREVLQDDATVLVARWGDLSRELTP
ncbi:PP2C family protein-serine/threonine phosphatase [Georgenia sp. H159]|uniref:PP2C family protein-serine/threonine phosphatase n=1 Tax=Georgenia sp. H159 TaxID=3076115 RepID=UPI002D77A22E|nr:PP2C family protein-serine/threonine phosphatase [Georgenia sp. H159]